MTSQTSSLVPVTTGSDLLANTENQLSRLETDLPVMSDKQLAATIIWCEAANQAAKARRAMSIAKKAALIRIKAQRRLGQLIDDPAYRLMRERETRRAMESGQPQGGEGELFEADWRRTGSYITLGKMPEALFQSVVDGLIERGSSADTATVLRIAHQQSLERVEHGIYQSWDGSYFVFSNDRGQMSGYARPRRSRATTIDGARSERDGQLATPRDGVEINAALDAAYARARVEAQRLSKLGTVVRGHPRKLVGEAELLQAQVAEKLWAAYREQKGLPA